MKNLLIIGAFVGIMIYVIHKTTAPILTATASTTPIVTAPLIYAASIGPTDAGNSYPGMLGAAYTPVPGSPGALMPVKATGFVGVQATAVVNS